MHDQRRWIGVDGLLLGGVILALLVVVALPVGMVLLQAVFPQLWAGQWDQPLSHWPGVFGDLYFLEALGNTLTLGLAVSLLSLVLATPLAYARGLYQVPGAQLWDLLLLIPFMMPPYIGAMAWTFTLQPGGYSTQVLGFSAEGWLFSLPGMVLVMALHLFPLVYFALSRTLSAIGWRYVDAARVCGANMTTSALKIVAPLSLPAVAASVLMVFSLTIEEYGTPSVLGRPSQFLVLVTRIEEKMAEWPIDLAGAALLSGVLLVLALGAYALHHWINVHHAHVTVAGKHASLAAMPLTPKVSVLVVSGFALVVLCAVVLPLAAMLLTAFSNTLSGGVAWSNLGLRHFASIWHNDGGAFTALMTSWGLAGLTALLAGALGAAAGFITVRSPRRARHAVDALSGLPNALPGMVLAVGLILLWNRSWWPFHIYGTSAVLLLAYVCLLLPYPVRYVASALRQISSNLDGAARVSGAHSGQILLHILGPMVAPHLFIAMMLVFAIASRELVASVMLSPPGLSTVSTHIFNQFAQGSPNEGMALAVVAVGLSTALMVVLSKLGPVNR
jgi:iron(III) transport system permease protein